MNKQYKRADCCFRATLNSRVLLFFAVLIVFLLANRLDHVAYSVGDALESGFDDIFSSFGSQGTEYLTQLAEGILGIVIDAENFLDELSQDREPFLGKIRNTDDAGLVKGQKHLIDPFLTLFHVHGCQKVSDSFTDQLAFLGQGASFKVLAQDLPANRIMFPEQ